jgi:hypothetical protein
MRESARERNGATRVELKGAGGGVSMVGPALAIIALVAVLGLIWMGMRLIDLSRTAIEIAPPAAGRLEPQRDPLRD